MTLSSALNNAMAGLNVASRTTEVIASNISNVNTPGYAKRILEQSATSLNAGGGVQVSGVVRVSDPGLVMARRSAQAEYGYASTISSFATGVETALGTPDDANALTNLLADFDAALLNASSRPDAQERLTAAATSAQDIVNAINEASDAVSDMRSQADQAISAQVTRLNAALEEVEFLNTKIGQVHLSGGDETALHDLRQVLIDEIHEIVPIKEAARDYGQVALYSEGGVILIDGAATEISFSPVRQVTPYMTLDGGQLSGLSVNGFSLRTGQENHSLPNGTLAAQFAIRDELGEDALAQIDAVARNLVERFQDPTVDPTLAPGDPGLFTDDGNAFDPVNETGLAERLQLNPLVASDQGGEEWRMRDGLGALAPGPVGDSTLIESLRAALQTRTAAASGDFGTGDLDITDIANSLLGSVGVNRLSAEQSLSFAAASFNEAQQSERAFGVDTDVELQNLLLVEQTYTANARMIETINEMLDTLMRIGS